MLGWTGVFPAVVFWIGVLIFCVSSIDEERITILPTFGIEFAHIWYTGQTQSEFIVWDEIDTVIINEGFRMFQVHYYLAILPTHQRKLYLPFKRMLPRLDILLPIYKEIKQLIRKYPAHRNKAVKADDIKGKKLNSGFG